MTDNIKIIPYKRTWCDYLTKCDVTGEMVGSWECEQCKFFVGRDKENIPDTPKDPKDDKYYTKYMVEITGIVKCKSNKL